MKQGIDKKKVGIVFLLTFVALICLGFLVSGATLIGLNYGQFDMYLTLVKVWNQNSGSASPGFDTYVTSYNALAQTNGWVLADYKLFATGLALLILGIIAVIVSVVVFMKKRNKSSVKQIKINKKV